MFFLYIPVYYQLLQYQIQTITRLKQIVIDYFYYVLQYIIEKNLLSYIGQLLLIQIKTLSCFKNFYTIASQLAIALSLYASLLGKLLQSIIKLQLSYLDRSIATSRALSTLSRIIVLSLYLVKFQLIVLILALSLSI